MDDKAWIESFNKRQREADKTNNNNNNSATSTSTSSAKKQKLTEADWSRLRQGSRANFLDRRVPQIVRERAAVAETMTAQLSHNVGLSEREVKKYEREVATAAEAVSLAQTMMKTNHAQQVAETYSVPDSQRDHLLDKRSRDEAELNALMQRNKQQNNNNNSATAKSSLDEQREIENRRLQDVGVSSNNNSNNSKRVKRGPDVDLLKTLAMDEVDFISEKILAQGDATMLQSMMAAARQDTEADIARMREEEVARRRMAISELRQQLPIFKRRAEILDTLEKNDAMVLVGDTGSGKSTQLIQYLRESGYTADGKRIACTQPRRVAAMSVSARVATEVGCNLGGEVGYRVRFEDKTSKKTELCFMTDGMLLREYLMDPELKNFSCIIIDEAHERALHTDVLLGLVRETFRGRRERGDPLRVIIASATLDAEKFSRYFDDIPIIKVEGRMYPVEVFYTAQPQQDYIEACVNCVLQIHLREPLGDVLVFLTGQDEIEDCAEQLQQRIGSLKHLMREMLIFPVYSTLPASQQRKIFEPTPPGARKVVIATNIAETSLTIDGIAYVVDCGFCKQNFFDPKTDMESLLVVPVSRAAAEQRKGRAGRTGPGKCFRLYTRRAYKDSLLEATVPEIQRTNIANLVLELKALGIENFLDFEFLDSPTQEYVAQAFSALFSLQAINAEGQLTKTGRRMAEFPLDPKLSRCLVASEKYNCSEQIATVAAMLSVSSGLYYLPRDKSQRRFAEAARVQFNRGFGDHVALLEIYEQWAAAGHDEGWANQHYLQYRTLKSAYNIRLQLLGLLERVEIAQSRTEDLTAVVKAVLCGFFRNIAKINPLTGTTYQRVKVCSSMNNRSGGGGGEVLLHPSCVFALALAQHQRENINTVKRGGGDNNSGVLPGLVVYYALRSTAKDYMVNVSAVDPTWLYEVAPHMFPATRK
eukprot:PhM_4_TR12160/c0_g1_i1/m.38194/K12813/DHX16; pre-mRNA-splicing factor ATP-dependent RNA helicase DHX16